MSNRTFYSGACASMSAAVLVAIAAVVLVLAVPNEPVRADSVDPKVIEEGKTLTFGRKKGNCLACHAIDDGQLVGNGGPALIQMKVRFPEKAKLRAQIWDATVANPNSLMPPFGRHGILSDAEIDMITEYIHTL